MLSDAGQRSQWPKIVECLNEGDMLYFSHGFSVTFKDDTGVVPPPHVDVALVAPKGSGRSVRRTSWMASGINASFAVQQDATGRAYERTIALGIAIGAGYLFPTTFKNEVYSRSDRRARRADGRAGGRDGSAVQRPAQEWTFSLAKPSTKLSKN